MRVRVRVRASSHALVRVSVRARARVNPNPNTGPDLLGEAREERRPRDACDGEGGDDEADGGGLGAARADGVAQA